MSDIKTKDGDKFALFSKIQEHKALLFGKFTNTVTKEAKDSKWEAIRLELIAEGHQSYEDKTAKQIKENWSLTKTRTVAKLDQAKKTGSGGIAKFTELEKLQLAILDLESPQIKGLDVSEAGTEMEQSPFPSPCQILKSPCQANKKRKIMYEEDPIDREIREEKARKLKLETQLLELQIWGKQLENQLLELQIEEKKLDISKKRSDSNYYA